MAINEIEMKKGEEFADKFLSSLGNEAFCRPDFAVGAWLLLMERISNKAAELCREKEEELNLRGRIVAEIFYQKSGELRPYIKSTEKVVKLNTNQL